MYLVKTKGVFSKTFLAVWQGSSIGYKPGCVSLTSLSTCTSVVGPRGGCREVTSLERLFPAPASWGVLCKWHLQVGSPAGK